MTVEEASGPPAIPWADNEVPAGVLVAMSTQWRVGPGGPYGLDYGVMPDVMRMLAVPRSQWADVLDCIRVMERAALDVMTRNKK